MAFKTSTRQVKGGRTRDFEKQEYDSIIADDVIGAGPIDDSGTYPSLQDFVEASEVDATVKLLQSAVAQYNRRNGARFRLIKEVWLPTQEDLDANTYGDDGEEPYNVTDETRVLGFSVGQMSERLNARGVKKPRKNTRRKVTEENGEPQG